MIASTVSGPVLRSFWIFLLVAPYQHVQSKLLLRVESKPDDVLPHHHRKLPNGRSDDHAYLIRYYDNNNNNNDDDDGHNNNNNDIIIIMDADDTDTTTIARRSVTFEYLARKASKFGSAVRHVHVSHNAIAVHHVSDIDAILLDDPDIAFAEPDGLVYSVEHSEFSAFAGPEIVVENHDDVVVVSDQTNLRMQNYVDDGWRRKTQLANETSVHRYVQNLYRNNVTNATLPLDWIDGIVDDKYTYNYTGRGVTIYVLDSGIYLQHSEFADLTNNSASSVSPTSSRRSVTCGLDLRNTTDCHDGWGHGTHVASTIAGNTFGVAKAANIVAVKVLADDGTARFSDVIAGLEYVYNETIRWDQNKNNNKNTTTTTTTTTISTRALVNLSLGTPRVAILLNQAVKRLLDHNVPVIVAAGNGQADACTWSPASTENVLAVAALHHDGTKKNYLQRVNSSNYGPCITLYAPGHQIDGAWNNNNNNSNNNSSHRAITGTSAAAPFVTGTAALYLERDPNRTVSELTAALRNDATPVYLERTNETVWAVTTKALLLNQSLVPSASTTTTAVVDITIVNSSAVP